MLDLPEKPEKHFLFLGLLVFVLILLQMVYLSLMFEMYYIYI